MNKELKPNYIELSGYEIWKNRRFEKWHLPFLTTIGPIRGCFNANCPYQNHYNKQSFTDPYSRVLIDKLSKAQPRIIKNMLIQTDCNGADETHYVTFNHVITNNDGNEELVFQERNISWQDIRYIALINNPHIKPFEKTGGQLLFREKLTQITGVNIEEVCTAMSQLDSLNWPEHSSVRMRFPEGTWINVLSRYFHVGITHDSIDIADEFQRSLNHIMHIKPIDIALTFGVITQQNKLSRLRSLITNWTPEKPDELIHGLNKFCEWYLRCIPDSEEIIIKWKHQWKNMLKLEF